MSKTILFILFILLSICIFLFVHYYKEYQDVTKILDQERYSRMVAEEDLQKGDYRIKKLEADLQTTQVKFSRLQESLDREREEKNNIKGELRKLAEKKESLEKNLRSALDKQDDFQAKADAAVRAEALAVEAVNRAVVESKAVEQAVAVTQGQ